MSDLPPHHTRLLVEPDIAARPVDPTQLEDGAHVAAHQGQLFLPPTFSELAAHYQEHLQGVRKRKQSRQSEDSMLSQALTWLSEHGYERPTTADWQRYFDWRLSAECPNRLTPSTVESHRATIRKVYKRCSEAPKRGWVLIGNPVTTHLIAPYWDASEAQPRAMANPVLTVPLIKAQMPTPTAKALVEVLDNQGLRIQEACGIPLPGSRIEKELGIRCLDLDGATLQIRKQRDRDHVGLSPLKTGYSAATVKLTRASVEALRESMRWQKEEALRPKKFSREGAGFLTHNYVFPFFRMHLDALMKIHREVAPEDFRMARRGERGGEAWHVYRHTYATYLGKQGIHIDEIHKLLRHKDPKTTIGYMRSLLVDARGSDAVMEAMDRKKRMQEQAMLERSGKGLHLVKKDKR